jgi:cyclopropane-fatty-acyl-phospholipid synthase
MSIFSPLIAVATTVLNTISTQTWDPFVSLCKNGTLSQLQGIKIGKLLVSEEAESKASLVFGSDEGDGPTASLHVNSEKFWVRVALFADMMSGTSLKDAIVWSVPC